MGRRIVIEEPCEHGEVDSHYWHPHKKIAMAGVPDNLHCPGGSRRTLTEGELIPVVRTSVLARTYAVTDEEPDAYLIPLDASAGGGE